MLVLKGLVGLIEPFNFSFFSITGWGIGLDYHDRLSDITTQPSGIPSPLFLGPLDFTFQDVWFLVSDHTIVIIWVMKIFFVQFLCVFLPHCTGDREQEHPQEKEMQKSYMAVWEALQIAVKRREAKSKGGKERYKHLNAEFQRIERRNKKTFLSDQCKEIEENNTMGKTRDLFKKIRDPKGAFHAKMGSIKGRNGMDLTEAEDTKRRCQEYTDEPVQ